jgi:hypothetical protein
MGGEKSQFEGYWVIGLLSFGKTLFISYWEGIKSHLSLYSKDLGFRYRFLDSTK